jgi:hypothetical protein
VASKREQVVEAVVAACQSIPLVRVERNRDRPTKIPPEGLIVVRDGDVGEPEVLLSPLSYTWTHGVVVELFTQSGDRDGHLDDMLAALQAALDAVPTLGGLVDYMQAGGPEFDKADPEGGADLKAATVVVRLTYETATPLS